MVFFLSWVFAHLTLLRHVLINICNMILWILRSQTNLNFVFYLSKLWVWHRDLEIVMASKGPRSKLDHETRARRQKVRKQNSLVGVFVIVTYSLLLMDLYLKWASDTALLLSLFECKNSLNFWLHEVHVHMHAQSTWTGCSGPCWTEVLQLMK